MFAFVLWYMVGEVVTCASFARMVFGRPLDVYSHRGKILETLREAPKAYFVFVPFDAITLLPAGWLVSGESDSHKFWGVVLWVAHLCVKLIIIVSGNAGLQASYTTLAEFPPRPATHVHQGRTGGRRTRRSDSFGIELVQLKNSGQLSKVLAVTLSVTLPTSHLRGPSSNEAGLWGEVHA